MQKLQELRGRRDTVAASARQLHADHKDKQWDHAAGEKYDQFISEINDLDNAISREQKFLDNLAEEKIDSQIDEAKAKRIHASGQSLFAKWVKGGDKAMSAQDWADIRATMSTTTPAEGGYTVPTDVYSAVLDVLKAYGGVRSVANIMTTEAGNPINFPTSDGTSEVGELIAENTTATGADPFDPTQPAAGAPLHKRFSKGFVYSDGWVDDARLVVLNAIDAAERGATVLTRCACVDAQRAATTWQATLRRRR